MFFKILGGIKEKCIKFLPNFKQILRFSKIFQSRIAHAKIRWRILTHSQNFQEKMRHFDTIFPKTHEFSGKRGANFRLKSRDFAIFACLFQNKCYNFYMNFKKFLVLISAFVFCAAFLSCDQDVVGGGYRRFGIQQKSLCGRKCKTRHGFNLG